MRRFSLLLALLILCPGAGGVEAPRNLNDYPTDHPMRIVVVRSSQPGCEPKCAEWISAEGDVVLATAELLRKVVNSLGGRKLPILIHSSGGGIINQATLMGFLIRDRGLDVAVARTVFDPCVTTPGGCKQGTWSGPLGERLSAIPLARLSSLAAFIVSSARKRGWGSKTTGSPGGSRKMAANLPGGEAGRYGDKTFICPSNGRSERDLL